VNFTPTQAIQYAAYLALLIIAGALEYFKILPTNSTAGVFLVIMGHFFGNIPTSNALARNTQAQAQASAANTTANALQAPTGPIHLVHHYDAPPMQSSPPVTSGIQNTASMPDIPTQPQVAFPSPALHFGDTAIVPAVQVPQ
jgi:hypothetical protein